jgi:hypothetical protein
MRRAAALTSFLPRHASTSWKASIFQILQPPSAPRGNLLNMAACLATQRKRISPRGGDPLPPVVVTLSACEAHFPKVAKKNPLHISGGLTLANCYSPPDERPIAGSRLAGGTLLTKGHLYHVPKSQLSWNKGEIQGHALSGIIKSNTNSIAFFCVL